MDIRRAKQEIKDSIEAYLAKDEFGEYQIPLIRQRPILLMGPPGIGKTQIMEQIAKECKIGLVSYTITHHTRQSAVGLPFIREKNYGGETVSITEYTMSEIIASVYEKIEDTGNKEGILFIDEVNCVSETLAPAMLQFLQGKSFGNRQVPEGWVIVTAGNPPEYNKSVREFDVVTLDRVKRIDVEENFEVWKEYAYRQEIHPAVISYLELRRKNFYRIENTIDGKSFATARGWEDLSRFIQVYETLGKTVDREVVGQYIQNKMIAKDFANYLELFYKYKQDYGIEDILRGVWDSAVVQKVKTASLDEHLSIIGLLNGKVSELFADCYMEDAFITKLYEYMLFYKENQTVVSIIDVWKKSESDLEIQRKQLLLSKNEEKILQRITAFLQKAALGEAGKQSDLSAAYEIVKVLFEECVEGLDKKTEKASNTLQNIFDFLEEIFGESQEMVAFMTELNANYYSIWFIKENGSDAYYKHNRGLLFEDRQKTILGQMDEMERMMDKGIK